jgi:hypothetical protein
VALDDDGFVPIDHNPGSDADDAFDPLHSQRAVDWPGEGTRICCPGRW